jgi:hypothetical protein
VNLGQRGLAAAALLGLAACGKKPCEPWISNGLAELASGAGQRIEACTPARLQWRVIPGGTRDAYLTQASRYPYSGWRLWDRRAWVRPGSVAVAMQAREVGGDLVVELWEDPAVDVAAALRSLGGVHGQSEAR